MKINQLKLRTLDVQFTTFEKQSTEKYEH